jgi:hypothetical protein
MTSPREFIIFEAANKIDESELMTMTMMMGMHLTYGYFRNVITGQRTRTGRKGKQGAESGHAPRRTT